MDLLKRYLELQKQIFDYFGYVEDWRAIPLDDLTDHYWMIVGREDNGEVVYSPDELTAETIDAGHTIYSGSIYTQRFLPKWVYRAAEFTMISVDTHTDGNKFLMVFDNRKECTDDQLKALYQDRWSLV